MGLDSLFPSDEKIKTKTKLDDSLDSDDKYRIFIEYRAMGFSHPLEVKGKVNPHYIIKEYSVSELEDILSGKIMGYLIKDDMSKWAIARAKEMLEKLGEKARVYIDKERKEKHYYLTIEREGSPISTLKYPISPVTSELYDLPGFLNSCTADELSDYLVKNDRLDENMKKIFEDALIILGKLGQDSKMHIVYEEKK